MGVAHALDTIRLHRLGLQVHPFNPRAIRVYEKCGFRHDGRLRGVLRHGGEHHEALEMSILRTDPRP